MKKIWYYRALLLMILPGVLWFAIFRYGPMYGMIVAFKEYNLRAGIMGSPWADPLFKHFQQFFSSRYFNQLISNTLILSVLKLFCGIAASVLLAILLNECKYAPFGKLIQTLTFMPHFLSWIIVYGIVLIFLSESGGLVNVMIKQMGGNSVPFMASPGMFRQILVFSDVWRDAGWGAIVYIAAIAGIDLSLYEAARIDGAGRLQVIFHITLPGIVKIIIVMLILRFGRVMDAGFDQVYIFYNVRVMNVSDIIDTWVFRTGLEQMNFSLASAVGLFKSVIGTVLIVTANKIANRWDEGIW